MEEKNKKEVFNGFDDILFADDFEDEELENESEENGNSEDEENESSNATETEEETPAESETEEEVDEEAERKKLEAQKNSEFAKRRRAREEAEKKEREAKEEKIRENAKTEAELGILKTNPFTDEPIKDKQDLEVYKIMKAIEDEGGDPINDLPKRLAQINRQREEKTAEEQKKSNERTEKINRETKELLEAYPKLDPADLAQDKEYLNLCEEKGGRWTMLEVYEHLLNKREKDASDSQKNKKEEVVKQNAKKVNKTPSSTPNGSGNSSDDYLNMSDEDFLEISKKKGDFF
jgi:trichohyalin